jgi:AcrR family transcriptional regulator
MRGAISGGTVDRDADRTRETILAAAEGVFAEYGFDASTMRAIGDAAGLSRGAAAYFFGSKSELYDAVLARVIERAPTRPLRPMSAACWRSSPATTPSFD